MPIVYTDNYTIRSSEINPQMQAYPHVLIQIMQEASMQHTIQNNISFKDLVDIHASWVLLKMEVQFYRFPVLGDRVKVETYPTGIQNFFTYRDYLMYDEARNRCATISSTWTLMDTGLRKMMRIPTEFYRFVQSDCEPLKRPDFRLKSIDLPYDLEFRRVNYLHLDWNGHVNNVQLLIMILECIPVDFVSMHSLSRLLLQYKHEALMGMELQISTHYQDELSMQHSITDTATGMEILLAYSEWEAI